MREPFRPFSLSFLNHPLAEEDGGGGAAAAAAAASRAGGGGARGPRGGQVARGTAGTVEGAGLVPSALVSFQWTEAAAPGRNTDGGAQCLTDALMSTAVPLE